MNPSSAHAHDAVSAFRLHASGLDGVQPGRSRPCVRGLYWHHAIYIGNGVLIEFGSGIAGGLVATSDPSSIIPKTQRSEQTSSI